MYGVRIPIHHASHGGSSPMKESKKLHRITAAALTVAFLGFIYAALGATLIERHHDLLASVQMTKAMRDTLPEHPTALDRLLSEMAHITPVM